MDKKIIIDFDSTFVVSEGLEELAKISLRNRADRDEIIARVAGITDKGMEGKISFSESLSQRIAVLDAAKEHVIELSEALRGQITPSFARNKNWINENKNNIYVFSGGFHDFIDEALLDFDLVPEQIFANYFAYDKNGRVVGFDQRNPLSQAGGKVRLLKELGLPRDTIVLGDGWTDYEMKQSGLAGIFIAFTENIRRERVVKVADLVAGSFDEVIKEIKASGSRKS